jgi:hypothetical protein
MKIYEGLDKQGSLVYFQVSNILLSRRAAYKLVAQIPGVSVTSWPKFLPFGREDVFCKFTLENRYFELWEPFGDNSRFHVSAKPLEACEALEQVRRAFQEYRPISGLTRWLLLATGMILICYRFYHSH